MAIYGVVLNAAGVQQGDGLIKIIDCAFTRQLDGAGTFKASLALTDDRNLALIRNEAMIRFLVETRDGSAVDIGTGVITSVAQSEDSSGSALEISGMDALQALARKSVLTNRTYDNQPIATVVTALAGLAGWTATATGLDSITVKLDGISVLKALVKIAEETGLHFRLAGDRTIEFGGLGEQSAAWALKLPGNSPRVTQSREILPISQFKIQYESQNLVNWMLVLGGGTDTNILTMAQATGGGAYTIQTIALPNAATGYYLADAASIARYGQIERVMKFDIQPISNSVPNIAKASQQLYLAAAAELARVSVLQTVYQVQCKRGLTPVQVGQRLRVTYRGIAEKLTGNFTYLDVDEYLYVLSVSETYGVNSDDVTLEVSNVDVRPRNGMTKQVETVETVEVAKIRGF